MLTVLSGNNVFDFTLVLTLSILFSLEIIIKYKKIKPRLKHIHMIFEQIDGNLVIIQIIRLEKVSSKSNFHL